MAKGTLYFHRARRKLGNTVGYVRGGEQIWRAYNPVVANPKTTKQVLQRAKLALMSELGKQVVMAVQVGYKGVSDTLHSPRNLFAKKNWSAITGNTPSALVVNYEALLMADGGRIAGTFGNPDFSTTGYVVVPIEGYIPVEGYCEATDGVRVVAYCPDMNLAVISDGNATLTDGSVQLRVPTQWAGMRVHVYAFTEKQTESGFLRTSPSTYVGVGTVS